MAKVCVAALDLRDQDNSLEACGMHKGPERLELEEAMEFLTTD